MSIITMLVVMRVCSTCVVSLQSVSLKLCSVKRKAYFTQIQKPSSGPELILQNGKLSCALMCQNLKSSLKITLYHIRAKGSRSINQKTSVCDDTEVH